MVTKLAIPTAKTASMFRLMRLLVHSGFFAVRKVCKIQQEEEEEGYVLTPSSRLLLKDNVMSVTPLLQAVLDPISMTPWNFLSEWFQGDGLTPFETAHGRTFWDYASQDIELYNIFNEAMASDARLVMSVVITKCKGVFEGLGSLVDVGGGTGTAAKTIVETFPSLKCMVFDLPHVVSRLKGNENLTYIAGDMFDSIPHTDAVLLKAS
ncbi:probable O-methyltransferase 3 [Telopea speciosissima]|uniref:probable O-methyltransferase 3 n=1 Tax=Telopea speciosissima TaxID=54955 RepID=UPI001CC34BFD|nr:probable O-methyltransferase 3 [Telopea speciosissima]